MRFIKTFALAGIPFGLAMGVVNGLRQGWKSGLGSGIAAGILFGFLLAFFLKRQAQRFEQLRPKYEPEGIVLDAPANLGGVGGWLFLTKQRLVFEPHKLNLGGKRTDVKLGDIQEVRPGAGKLVRRFEVVVPGATHSFLVENRDQWLAAFTPLLAVTSTAGA
ncbi:MAG TPA: hypothetical protein VL326_02865 [Kofleriaceae bacterium]|nr:hypothetical protein [Kofleriaceae bacterium]